MNQSLERDKLCITQKQIEELKNILNIDDKALNASLPRKQQKKRNYYHPRESDLKRVTKSNRIYSYDRLSVSLVEIQLIEAGDFEDKVKIVKGIRNFIAKNAQYKYSQGSPWSVLECCFVMMAVYDHEMRNEVMQVNTLNSIIFYDEFVKITGFSRKHDAFKRKIREVRDWNLEDLQSIQEFIQREGNASDRLNNLKMYKNVPTGKMVFEDKGGLMEWNNYRNIVRDNPQMLHQTPKFDSQCQTDLASNLEDSKFSREHNIQNEYYQRMAQILNTSASDLQLHQEKKDVGFLEFITHYQCKNNYIILLLRIIGLRFK